MKRLVIIAAAGLAMGAVGADLITRPAPARRVALAIADGYRRTAAVSTEAMEDGALGADADDAGYRWAERRAIDNVSACPNYTAQFTAGCRAWVQDEQPTRQGTVSSERRSPK